VLVAAEQSSTADTIAAVLRAAGYSVATATSPTRAAARVRSAGSPTELLVLDGCDRPWAAAAFLDALRDASSAVPIILIAGQDAELRAEAERVGVDVVLDAPFDSDRLLTAAMKLVPVVRDLDIECSS
jgi:CheY-like chemotaxis protein